MNSVIDKKKVSKNANEKDGESSLRVQRRESSTKPEAMKKSRNADTSKAKRASTRRNEATEIAADANAKATGKSELTQESMRNMVR